MSVLTLVRHGQASFLAEQYDQLSAVGEEQARRLGEFWGRQGLRIDEIYAGPRVRQKRSAELAVAAARQAGLTLPDPVVLQDLDEYDLHGLVHHLAPELVRSRSDFAGLVAQFRSSTGEQEKFRSFQQMFEVLLEHWQSLAETHPELEAWPAFCQRVDRALLAIRNAPGRGRRVVLFTSGGFIGSAVQRTLSGPERTALELSWRIRNGSMTEFVFTRDRCTLDCFNTVPHLNPELWTYR